MRKDVIGFPVFWAASCVLVAVCSMSSPNQGQAQTTGDAHWMGTRAASPVRIDNRKGTLGSSDFIIQQIVHTSLAGNVARVVFTNEMGTAPLTIAEAQAALSNGDSAIAAESAKVLTFNCKHSVTIPAGAKVFSYSFPMAFRQVLPWPTLVQDRSRER
jgi:hypothetical protein